MCSFALYFSTKNYHKRVLCITFNKIWLNGSIEDVIGAKSLQIDERKGRRTDRDRQTERYANK